MENRKPYKLLKGTHDAIVSFNDDGTPNREIKKAGDIVLLTDDQYKNFKDRFTPVSETHEVADKPTPSQLAAMDDTSKVPTPPPPGNPKPVTPPSTPSNAQTSPSTPAAKTEETPKA